MSMGRTQIAVVWEQNAQDNNWPEGRGSNRRSEKTVKLCNEERNNLV
jgi:hypothetical protein